METPMNHYVDFLNWRQRLVPLLGALPSSVLTVLCAELRSLARQLDTELANRQAPPDRRDGRLYRQRQAGE